MLCGFGGKKLYLFIKKPSLMHYKSLIFLLLLSFSVVSCKKSGSLPEEKKEVDIYITGCVYTGSSNSGFPVAAYWKNNIAVTLPHPHSIYAEVIDIEVIGRDLYALGYYSPGPFITVNGYWKNGVFVNLTEGNGFTEVNSIYNNGSDLYITGSVGTKAAYWKNGKVITVDDGSYTRATVNDMVINNTDIYLAGSAYDITLGYKVPCYWKNGIKKTLPSNDSGGDVTNIITEKNDIYISGSIRRYPIIGYQTDQAAYWKNDILNTVAKDEFASVATGITIKSTEVYVCGWSERFKESPWTATYWKGGNIVKLSSDYFSSATAIAVNGSDLYISGLTSIGAGYWKNGVLTTLAVPDGTYPATANNIILVDK